MSFSSVFPGRTLIVAVAAVIFLTTSFCYAEPETELLWPAGATGAKGASDNDKPTMTVFLPPAEKATGAAVVVCPGGGYGGLAISYEGMDVAEWLNSFGVAGFVLKYRHKGSGYQHPPPLDDAQRAIRTVRAGPASFGSIPRGSAFSVFRQADIWPRAPARILTKVSRTQATRSRGPAARPDFLILCYPVISLTTPYTHQGSKKNLLGENPDPKLVELMSNELQVTAETPPTFLWHTDADTGVPPENSVLFYLALKKAKVPAELHIFEHGRHGLGLARGIPGAGAWPDLCATWMRGRGLLEQK